MIGAPLRGGFYFPFPTFTMGVDPALNSDFPSVLIDGETFYYGREPEFGQSMVSHPRNGKRYWCFKTEEEMLGFLENLPESARPPTINGRADLVLPRHNAASGLRSPLRGTSELPPVVARGEAKVRPDVPVPRAAGGSTSRRVLGHVLLARKLGAAVPCGGPARSASADHRSRAGKFHRVSQTLSVSLGAEVCQRNYP